MGEGGTILHSSDTQRWDPQISGTKSSLFSLFGAQDGKSLWAVGAGGAIVHSGDGQHWEAQKSGTDSLLYSVFGSGDGKSLWAVGEGGTILHSGDGEHWDPQTSGTREGLRWLFGTLNGKSLWAVGFGGTILHSSDGEHWDPQISGTREGLRSVFGTEDGKSFWTVGASGTILHSGDGQHWDPQTSGRSEGLNSVLGTQGGKPLWAVGEGGTILRSSDGQHWDVQISGTKKALFSVFAAQGGKYVWAVGAGTIVMGSTTTTQLPFLSAVRVYGASLSIYLTCPEGSQAQGSVDVSASGDNMPGGIVEPKPVGSLQINPTCKVNDFQFDPAALNIASGAKVHFFVTVNLTASTQNYTVDATYAPWRGYGIVGAGGFFIVSLVFLFLQDRNSAQARPSVREIENSSSSLENPEYRVEQAIRAKRHRSEEEQLVKNLDDDFLLRSFELKDVRFFEDGTYEFRPRVNVLLGRNGYGKTLLLRTLAATIQSDLANGSLLFPPPAKRSSAEAREPKISQVTLRVERNEEPEETVRDPEYFSKTTGRIPLLAIPDSRFVNRQVRVFTPPAIVPEPLSRSGARHFITQEPYENKVLELLYNLCLDYTEKEQGFQLPFGGKQKIFEQEAFGLIQQVVRELTGDERFAFHSISRVSGTIGYQIFVRAEGNEDEPLPIQYASQGTLSVLVIFGQIFNFLRTLRPKITGDAILQAPGIVLIDEIDAHLHPSWQQKVMGMLTRHFPNVQFIVSAHSPLIVAGCDRKEVAVLRRSSTGDRFCVEMLEQDFLGAHAQDLYKLIFEIDDMDRLYLEYSAKAASGAGENVKDEIERIERTLSPTPNQQRRLKDLYHQEHLLQRAVEVRETRLDTEATRARIEILENEIEGLKDALRNKSGTAL